MRIISISISLFIFTLLAACSGSGPSVNAEKKTITPPNGTAPAAVEEMPRMHEAVGTVQARTDVRIEAQVTGRVMKVNVRPGDTVKRGDELLVLDSRQLETRLDQSRQGLQSAQSAEAQARQAITAAQAGFKKAESTYRRMQQLFDEKVITAEELEKSETAFLQARAELARARDALSGAQASVRQAEKGVQESEIGLGYTTINAPEDGEIGQRFADPGDLAVPGKALLSLQTSGGMRLEAMVRESLVADVRIGQRMGVIITALGPAPVQAVVEEIEPLADPVTRSFMVKAGLPDIPDLYPGMFGRLLVPTGMDRIVTVPASAVRRVGQLETVLVKQDESWVPVNVRTGEKHGYRIEVLSGLDGTETVGTD